MPLSKSTWSFSRLAVIAAATSLLGSFWVEPAFSQVKLDVKKPGNSAAAANPARVLAPGLIKRASKNCPPLVAAKPVGPNKELFQNVITWDRCDNQLLLVLFVNAASDKGIAIQNVQAGDQVLIGDAVGIASFDENKGSPRLAGFIGVVAKGAEIAVAGLGCPTCVPGIEVLNGFVQNELKEPKDNAEKRRDPYGVDPSSKHKARQEGGLIVCFPGVGGLKTSGDNEKNWIRKPGNRTDKSIPDSARGCFFPVAGNEFHNIRKIKKSGIASSVLWVGAWDHKFGDNKGFYQVFLMIEKAGTKQTKPNIESPD